MKQITMGMLMDMLIEAGNDSYEYPQMATQEDFDFFMR